jgi:hypothetical protein
MIDTKNCSGCHNDFYNGHNDLGVKKCWHAQDATMVTRLIIHVDQPPPYLNVKPRTVPSCYKAQRFATVKPESLDSKGYWK